MADPTTGILLSNASAANPGANLTIMYQVLGVENPSFDPYAVSPTKVRGAAQIIGDTWKTIYGPNVPYSIDPAAQADALAKLVAKYNTDYNGDVGLVEAAYNGGPGVANLAKKFQLENPNLTTSQAVAQAAAQIYPGDQKRQHEINSQVAKIQGTTVASVQDKELSNLTVAGELAVPILSVSGMGIPADQLAAVNEAIAPALIIKTGLGQPSWSKDPEILQVDGSTRSIPTPIVFQIMFQKQDSLLPISINMMASVRTFQKSMRHVISKQKTRTGLLVNLWGMECDMITGAASTGMMANQLGLTDFLSLSTAPDYLKQAVEQTYQNSDQVASDVIQAGMENEGFFRIAAKDAFVEFLAMFKNNGNVWFRNENYTGVTTQMEQTGADAWSPVTGSSTFQNVSRRNDIMTRGQVVMNFRNARYYGYFKSLSWVMDAKSPYRWNFNFVFQVESTSLDVGVPVL